MLEDAILTLSTHTSSGFVFNRGCGALRDGFVIAWAAAGVDLLLPPSAYATIFRKIGSVPPNGSHSTVVNARTSDVTSRTSARRWVRCVLSATGSHPPKNGVTRDQTATGLNRPTREVDELTREWSPLMQRFDTR